MGLKLDCYLHPSTGLHQEIRMSRRIQLQRYRSNEEWYFDDHTLFLKFDGYGKYAPKPEVISQAIQDSIKVYNDDHPDDAPLRSSIKVFMLKNKTGCLGTACVHLSNSAVYHMLRGCNPDGSPRIIYQEPEVPTQSSSPPESWQEFPTPLKFSSETSLESSTSSTEAAAPALSLSASINWAELSEQEMPAQKHMKVAVTLDPLMTLEPVLRTAEEMEAYKEVKGYLPPTNLMSLVVDIAGVRKSVVNDYDSTNSLSIITGTVPVWVTANILLEAFKPYASSSKVTQFDGSREIILTYPYVKLVKEKNHKRAFISFDPTTLDGAFAAVISKHFPLSDGVNSGEYYFGFACRKIFRDVVTEIEKRHHNTHITLPRKRPVQSDGWSSKGPSNYQPRDTKATPIMSLPSGVTVVKKNIFDVLDQGTGTDDSDDSE